MVERAEWFRKLEHFEAILVATFTHNFSCLSLDLKLEKD